MDMEKKAVNAHNRTVPDLSGEQIVVGAKQLRKALKAGRANRVYLARNADPAMTEPVEILCRQNNVEYAWVKSMTDLGHACGIEVGATMAAVVQ